VRRPRGLRLPLPAADLDLLRERVVARAENRPGVYRMTGAHGEVLYVGKAKRLRDRLLCYFRARYPEDKAARILRASHDIRWDYVASEFAAYLTELGEIRRWRPRFNLRLNRARRAVFITVSRGPVPRIASGNLGRDDARRYGPFHSARRTAEAVRTLNDLLGLRDCPATMPMVFAEQRDLFDLPRRAGCLRHEFGSCTGPCAGLVAEREYWRRVETALAFLEGRTIQPIDRVVRAMQDAAERGEYERAAKWREKFEHLEWLFGAVSRARTAVDLLSFVYRDPGARGEDRFYLIRRGVVKATLPLPGSPAERAAFAAAVAREAARADPPPGPLPGDSLDELLLIMAWFRAHPEALRRTTSYRDWLRQEA